MSLRTALDRIVAIQEAVSITDPATVTIKQAYKLVSSQTQQLPDLPAIINTVSYVGQVASAGMRTLSYRVQMDCAVAKMTVEDDRSADIAVALWEQMLDDFCEDVTLAGTVTLALFEDTGTPIPADVIWNNMHYVGFGAVLNIRITTPFNFS